MKALYALLMGLFVISVSTGCTTTTGEHLNLVSKEQTRIIYAHADVTDLHAQALMRVPILEKRLDSQTLEPDERVNLETEIQELKDQIQLYEKDLDPAYQRTIHKEREWNKSLGR